MSGVKHGGTFRPRVRCLIQKNNIESLKHESPRWGAEMGQIYSVLRDLLRSIETAQKSLEAWKVPESSWKDANDCCYDEWVFYELVKRNLFKSSDDTKPLAKRFLPHLHCRTTSLASLRNFEETETVHNRVSAIIWDGNADNSPLQSKEKSQVM